MKSPDRDAAEATRLEAIIIAYDRLQATTAEAIAKAEREAEEHKTDAEFWKHNAEVRASELATLRRRVAEIDQKLVAWFEAQLQLEQGAFSGAMTHDMRALQRAANEAKHTVFDLAREAASPLPPGRNEG